jgi:Hint domain
MFLEGVLIEAIDLINGVSIVQVDRVERVDYFHIELDTHDIIIAEGALSESFVDDDSRGIFQNAHEFAALYPNMPTERPTRYCAPRLAFGTQVEVARRLIAQRAGIPYTPSSNAKRSSMISSAKSRSRHSNVIGPECGCHRATRCWSLVRNHTTLNSRSQPVQRRGQCAWSSADPLRTPQPRPPAGAARKNPRFAVTRRA